MEGVGVVDGEEDAAVESLSKNEGRVGMKTSPDLTGARLFGDC